MLLGTQATRPTTLDQLLGPTLAAQLDRMDLLSRKLLAGKLPGERRSKRRGRSVEFDDFRPYVAGDDLRHIDWNILGRLDKLFVKLFREEEDLALHLIVDASPSMETGAGEQHKLAFACRLAMALTYVGLVNQNRVSIAAFGLPERDRNEGEGPAALSDIRRLAPMRGRSGVRRGADFLLGVLRDGARRGGAGSGAAGGPEASFARACRVLGAGSASRGITVLISDFLLDSTGAGEDVFAPLGYLTGTTAGAMDVAAIQVLTPETLDPTLAREAGLLGDLRLVDVETSKAREVTVTPATIVRYRTALEAHQRALRRACLSRGIAHYLVPTDTNIETLVVGTLRKGGLLR